MNKKVHDDISKKKEFNFYYSFKGMNWYWILGKFTVGVTTNDYLIYNHTLFEIII